jgi:hypothetical protein
MDFYSWGHFNPVHLFAQFQKTMPQQPQNKIIKTSLGAREHAAEWCNEVCLIFLIVVGELCCSEVNQILV